mgnify:CR=1 FL=1
MNWLCWHVGTVTDPKISRIADNCKVPRAFVIALWAMILEIAKDRRGAYSIDPDDAAHALGCDVTSVTSILAAMHTRKMLSDGAVHNWSLYQFGTSAERMRKMRSKENQSDSTEKHSDAVTDVTSRDVTVTPTVHDSTVQTEKNRTPTTEINPLAGGALKKARASRLPPDWVPSDKLALWFKTERPDLNFQKTVDHFRDYWHSRGAGGAKLDWDKTFRNWTRSQRAINGFAKSSGPKPLGYGSQPG